MIFIDFRCDIEREFKYNLTNTTEKRVALLGILEKKYPETYLFQEVEKEIIPGIKAKYYPLLNLGAMPLDTQIRYITKFELGFHSGDCELFYENKKLMMWKLSDGKVLLEEKWKKK